MAFGTTLTDLQNSIDRNAALQANAELERGRLDQKDREMAAKERMFNTEQGNLKTLENRKLDEARWYNEQSLALGKAGMTEKSRQFDALGKQAEAQAAEAHRAAVENEKQRSRFLDITEKSGGVTPEIAAQYNLENAGIDRANAAAEAQASLLNSTSKAEWRGKTGPLTRDKVALENYNSAQSQKAAEWNQVQSSSRTGGAAPIRWTGASLDPKTGALLDGEFSHVPLKRMAFGRQPPIPPPPEVKASRDGIEGATTPPVPGAGAVKPQTTMAAPVVPTSPPPISSTLLERTLASPSLFQLGTPEPDQSLINRGITGLRNASTRAAQWGAPSQPFMPLPSADGTNNPPVPTFRDIAVGPAATNILQSIVGTNAPPVPLQAQSAGTLLSAPSVIPPSHNVPTTTEVGLAPYSVSDVERFRLPSPIQPIPPYSVQDILKALQRTAEVPTAWSPPPVSGRAGTMMTWPNIQGISPDVNSGTLMGLDWRRSPVPTVMRREALIQEPYRQPVIPYDIPDADRAWAY